MNKDWIGNGNSIWKTLGASNHTEKERESLDFYATSPIAIDKLLTVETPNHNIWECACVDSETEYFNGYEWKPISNYINSDLVLCFDSLNNTAKLDIPIKYYKEKYNGIFYHYKSKDLDMKLTPEHRVVYLHRRNKTIQVDTMNNIYQKYVQDSNGFRGTIPTCFNFIPKKEINDIDEWLLRLAVACNADGRQRGKNSYEIRIKKDRKNIRLKYLLDKANIKYKYKFYANYHSYTFNSPLGCKNFPKEWINLSYNLKKVFIDEITKWDGTEAENGSKFYFSNKKNDVDLVQFIAHSIGIQVIINIDKRPNRANISYRLKFKNKTNHCLSKKPKNNFLIEHSVDGYKYCFSVPTGMLILRRNGKIFITGNCGEGHLSKRLNELGFSVYSTDLVKRNFELDGVVDFLQTNKLNFEYDILTNPPYKYAKEFVLKALNLLQNGRKAYMFLKLTFLEGKSRYKDLFSKHPPKSIYVFSERIMCAKNGDFEGMKAGGGSAVAYAWFVWEKGFKGNTIIKWI